MNHNHKQKLIMCCTHVIDNKEKIGLVDDEIKDTTILCQKCIDFMHNEYEKFEKTNGKDGGRVPNDVHLYCKECVIKKLYG